MTEKQLDRHLQTIAKWYFIKFYEYVNTPPVDAGYLLSEPNILRYKIQEHYNRNKRIDRVNPNGLKLRENCIYNLMKKNEMKNALIRVITSTKKQLLVEEAKRVYRQIHHREYV